MGDKIDALQKCAALDPLLALVPALDGGGIQELLAQQPFSVIEVTPEPREEFNPSNIPLAMLLTRELYAGLKRNIVALPPYVYNAEYYEFEEADRLYTDTGNHSSDFIYLQGLFFNRYSICLPFYFFI